MLKKSVYLYCIIKEKNPKKFDILGQEKKQLYTINQGDLSAVVSDSSVKEYPLWREYIDAHQKSIEEVMKQGYDVLPVKFSTVAESVKDVKEKILKVEAKRLEKEYEKIEDRVELNIKALWKDMPGVFKEINTYNPMLRAAKAKARKGQLSHDQLIGMGEIVKQNFEEKKMRERDGILNCFKKLAVKWKSKEIIETSELMKNLLICDIAFLVPKENEKKFDKTVADLAKKHEKRIKFLYVGPFPPYNFVELHLNVKRL